jgi:hypothetical protein
VIAAYIEPSRRGRLEPATHREVAAGLSCHPNSAGEALLEVCTKLFAAGIPIPDVAEKRVAVAEAARLHRLLEGDGGEPPRDSWRLSCAAGFAVDRSFVLVSLDRTASATDLLDGREVTSA